MIKTTFIPLAIPESSFPDYMTSQQRHEAGVKAREYAEAGLNQMIESGWSILHTERVEDASGLYVAYTMYKPDQDCAANPFGLTESKAPTMLYRKRKFTNC